MFSAESATEFQQWFDLARHKSGRDIARIAPRASHATA
jgi:hypothetical protein